MREDASNVVYRVVALETKVALLERGLRRIENSLIALMGGVVLQIVIVIATKVL